MRFCRHCVANMGMYRIKSPSSLEQNVPSLPEGTEQEYWRERHEKHKRDLDFDEIDALNAVDELSSEDEPPKRRKFPLWLGLLFVIILLILPFTTYLHGENIFPILSRSAELSQDEAIANLKSAVVTIDCGSSTGTGFNLAPEGLIVTNLHVVEDSKSMVIQFPSEGKGNTFIVSEYYPVSGVDLALIPLSGENLPVVNLASTPGEPGDEVVFIGNPLGYNWTVADGRILDYVLVDDVPCYYLSGPIRPGSSGSPVYNSSLQVIGIVFASAVGEEDCGFAIPVSFIQQDWEEIMND